MKKKDRRKKLKELERRVALLEAKVADLPPNAVELDGKLLKRLTREASMAGRY